MIRPRVATGLDRVAAGEPAAVKLLRGRRVGLLAHPASVTAQLRHALDVLEHAGAQVAVLFGPEHGWTGQAQDMIAVDGGRGRALPVYSLYGERYEDLSPHPEWLQDLDAVVIDLQDVGSRYYTFVWSAALMLESAAAQGVPCVVLDRPNPLGGLVVEGAPPQPGHQSFVGLYDVAVRHGMTLAEIVGLVHREHDLPAEALQVVRMEGWRRSMLWEDTGLPWVLPSPNMPTPDTARVYPGGCLLEGTNLSEGRGLTRPFEIWGAPFVDGEQLARLSAPGAVLRPLCFEPTFHKHGRKTCGGVQVHVTDPDVFRPFDLYMRAIAEVAWQAPDDFAWRTEPYEFVADRPAIDLLTGGPDYRHAVAAGPRVLEDVLAFHREEAEGFAEARRQHFLY